MQYKFKKGEVVWAKIRGFPWWPGMIALIEENKESNSDTKVLVNFIGDKSHAELTIDKLEKFKEKYHEFSKTKQKYLSKSIQIAKKIYNGDLTYENHFKYIKHKNSVNSGEDSSSSSSLSSKEDYESSINSLKKKTKKRVKIFEKIKNSLTLLGNDYYKNPDVNSISSSAIQLEENVKKSDSDSLENMSLKKILDELVKNTISLPSAYNEKLTLDNLNRISEVLIRDIDECFYELFQNFTGVLDSLIISKNQEISRKASELICLLKDKVLVDLFNVKNKKFEDLFSNSMKYFRQEFNNPSLFIQKGTKKASFNSNSNFKNQKAIIEEISNFLLNKDNTMFKQLSPDKNRTSFDKAEKNLTASVLSNHKTAQNFIETNVDEKGENKDFSAGLTTSTTVEVKNNNYLEKEVEKVTIEKEKAKIIHIFKEIKDKYFHRKDKELPLSQFKDKVYAQRLEKDQIFDLFSKYFEEKNNNSSDFHSFLLNGSFLENKIFLAKKSKRKESLSEKDLEKSFYMRKGICQHLSKVLNKLIPEMKREIANNLSRFIENLILLESNNETSNIYEKNIKQLFNSIKSVLFNKKVVLNKTCLSR